MTELSDPTSKVDKDRLSSVLQGAPFDVLNPESRSKFVLICDHAESSLPEEYGTLGVPGALLDEHIAYDIGAANMTRRMAETLGATAVLSRFSRLLIDPNRSPDHQGLIPMESDGVDIPGNKSVDAEERGLRRARYYDPYHRAIDRAIAAQLAQGFVPAIVGIHSFTPVMQGEVRPWEAGILWNNDPRLARPLIDILGRNPSLTIGDNLPYSGKLLAYSLDHHGGDHGLPNVVIEIRQDLVDSAEKAYLWADILANVLQEIEQDCRIFKIEHY